MSHELAEEKGIHNGDWVTVVTKRGEVEGRALVTRRMRPFVINGQTVHEIGIPWHWGYQGLASGDVTNDISALVADPNVSIHEGKVFSCNLRPGRRSAPGSSRHGPRVSLHSTPGMGHPTSRHATRGPRRLSPPGATRRPGRSHSRGGRARARRPRPGAAARCARGSR